MVKTNKMRREVFMTILLALFIGFSCVYWKCNTKSSTAFHYVKIIFAVPETETLGSNVTERIDTSMYCPSNLTKPEVEDILCMKQPTFLSEFKNPCWRKSNGRLRCLPYFQLIGMDKSGSSDLFNRLTMHPHIFGNSGLIGKEATWWSWFRYGLDLGYLTSKKLNFEDYLNIFDVSTRKIEQIIDNKSHYPAITGDGTPMDMWDFRGWTQIPQNRGLKEPVILTPHLIKHVNPNVKLIVILRNPIDRLYSDFYFLPGGMANKTPKTFDMAVKDVWAMIQNCTKTNSMRWCLYDFEMHAQISPKARLFLGFYSVYLKEWLAVFPREQIFIIRTEDYSENIYLYMKRLFQFLGVRNLTRKEMEDLKITSKERAYQTAKKKKAGRMLPQTRRTLQTIYQPYNDELARMLNSKVYEWRDNR